jgi:hypothetical protein
MHARVGRRSGRPRCARSHAAQARRTRAGSNVFSAWTTYDLRMAGHTPSEEGGTDWRRLASDRNVSPGVARALWEQARAAAPDDPAQAEHAFHLMLDEAQAENITQEPGRETLASSAPNARDASALGPGKWTRVLLEQPKPAGAAPRGADPARPAAERLFSELVAAGQAGKHAAALLAASDPATIVAALRELGGSQGSGVLQKVMSAASGAVERMLSQRSPAPSQTSSQPPSAQAGPAAPATTAGHQGAQGTPDRPVAAPSDRKR